MSWIDLLIIVAYLAGVLAAGSWFTRRQTSTRQYFLAGRNVPWWAISASIVATETSTITFISVPGIAFSRGGDFGFLQLAFGYIVGRFIIALFFIPAYFRGSIVTVYELLQEPFGPAVRTLASSLFIVMRSIADAVRLLLTGIVLAAVITAFIPASDPALVGILAIVTLGVVMIAFTFAGGMEAVLWIEVAQLGVYLLGAVASAVVLVQLIPGGLSAAIPIARDAGKLVLFDFAPDLSRTFTFWAGLIGGATLTMSTHGTDQFMVQRYLCARGPRPAATAVLVSGFVVCLQFALFLAIGALLFVFYRPDLQAGYESGSPSHPFAAPDHVFPAFLTDHLPTGVAGLVVAAIFAAALSSSLNSIAAAATHDIWRRFARVVDDRRELTVSRVVTILAGVVQIALALTLSGQTRSALDLALAVASLLNGPVLGVFVLAWRGMRGTVLPLIAMSVGLVSVTAVWQLTSTAWPWFGVAGAVSTVLAGELLRRLPSRRQT